MEIIAMRSTEPLECHVYVANGSYKVVLNIKTDQDRKCNNTYVGTDMKNQNEQLYGIPI